MDGKRSRILACALLSAQLLALGPLAGCGGGADSSRRSATTQTGGTTTGGSAAAPSLRVATPQAAQSGTVLLAYDLIDAEHDLCDVSVEFSEDAGASWSLASEGLGGDGTVGLASSASSGLPHIYAWDSLVDIGLTNQADVRLRLTPSDGLTGAPGETGAFTVVNAGRTDPQVDYDDTRGQLVIEIDRFGGLIPPQIAQNHIVKTRIYGDGKVVYVESGSDPIYQGQLSELEIMGLLTYIRDQGYWQMSDTLYTTPMAPTDMPTSHVSVNLRGGTSKRVSVYWGPPAGFTEIYTRLSAPQLQPTGVLTYQRQTITQAELSQGWYYGMEYQKKLDTPTGWTWVDAGRSSRWTR